MALLKRPFYVVMGVVLMTTAGCGSHSKSSSSESSDSVSSASSSSTAVQILGQLNDTGIVRCADSASESLDCPVDALPNQDAEVGRDAMHAQGLLDKQGGGMYGFDWTKLGGDGQPLSDQSVPWATDGDEAANSQWTCIQDNVTHLTWEVKDSDPQHPRYGQHLYTWYWENASLNGGDPGMLSVDSESCPTSPCNSQNYVAWVNEQRLCGFSDWRLPSVSELMSIAVYSESLPALDTHYFPNASLPRFFTRNTVANDPKLAWYVYFSDASVSFTNKSDPSYLRLVRGGLQGE